MKNVIYKNIPGIRKGICIGRSKLNGDIGRISIYEFNESHKRIVGQINPSNFVIAPERIKHIVENSSTCWMIVDRIRAYDRL